VRAYNSVLKVPGRNCESLGSFISCMFELHSTLGKVKCLGQGCFIAFERKTSVNNFTTR
jgi:hypothetical protein